jgi:hypothetical protein
MKSYKDLEIYRSSYDLAVEVHRFSLTLPQYEMYEEGSQVRKSSKGISSCIAEGYGRKKYKAEFIKFLVYPVRNNAPLLPPGQAPPRKGSCPGGRPSGPAAAAGLDFRTIPGSAP